MIITIRPNEPQMKRRRGNKFDYKELILLSVLSNPGITKDRVVSKLKGARNPIHKAIQELIDQGTLEYKNGGLYINAKNMPDVSKRRENLHLYLKIYRETVWQNIFPRLEKDAAKSGKPIFYTEPAADVVGKDARTGEPMSGEIQRINEKCKNDLQAIMYEVNKLIRASFSLYIVQISSQKENTEEIKNEQKDALDEIAKTKRKLLEMTAQGGSATGIATFQMWWFQLTAGLQMQEDNLVWIKDA